MYQACLPTYRGTPRHASRPSPVSLLGMPPAHHPFHCWVRYTQFFKSSQKTLEWSTILSIMSEMSETDKPGYSRFTVGYPSDVPLLTLLVKNWRKRRPGTGVRGRRERWERAGQDLEGGSEDIPRGVERFWCSLCRVPFCSGFVGRYGQVSAGKKVYSEGEKGVFCPREPLTL